MPVPARKSAWVRPMFDSIAPRYDLLNRLISFGMDRSWRRHAVTAALTGRPRLMVDVGTGTGDLAFEFAGRDTSGTTIIGLDFSAPMLGIGRQRAKNVSGSDRIHFVAGDALDLPLPGESVDVVVSAFVLRNLDSLPAAFAAMAKAIRRGGRLVLLEMTPIRQPVFRFFFRLYFRRWVPVLGRLISRHPDAYTWLPESVDNFIGPEEVSAQLEASGFADVQVKRLAFGTVAMHVATRR